MRASWLKRQIARQVELGVLRYFWTLTVRTSQCSSGESSGFISEGWNRLRTLLVRRYGSFEFVWTREYTRAGWAHLHLLTSLGVSSGDLSGAWLRATGGSWIVDVQSVASDRAASYLAKYCTEQATEREIAGGTATKARVFSKSRGVVFEPFIRPSEGAEQRIWLVGWKTVAEAARGAPVPISGPLRGQPSLLVPEGYLDVHQHPLVGLGRREGWAVNEKVTQPAGLPSESESESESSGPRTGVSSAT